MKNQTQILAFTPDGILDCYVDDEGWVTVRKTWPNLHTAQRIRMTRDEAVKLRDFLGTSI